MGVADVADVEELDVAVGVFAFQYHADFDFRRQDFTRLLADVFVLDFAEVVIGREGEFNLVADVFAVQRRFDFREGSAVATVQVGKRFAVVDDGVALIVIEFVGDFNDAVFADFHGFSLVCGRRIIARRLQATGLRARTLRRGRHQA